MHSKFRPMAAALFLLGTGVPLSHAAAPATPQGYINMYTYPGDQRPAIQAGTATPNGSYFPKRMEGPYNGFPGPDPGDDDTMPSDNVMENYNTVLKGYFYPPKDGKIQFAIATDDPGQLYLSTDDDPAHKVQIASESQWNPRRAFGGAFDGTTATRRTIISTGDAPVPRPENWSPYIQVTKGKPYYIEAVGTEFGGGDNTAVAFRYDGDPDFQDGDKPIPGQYLSPFSVPSAPRILSQPKDASVFDGSTATFSVGVELPPGTTLTSTKWQKNGTDIPNSDNQTLSLPVKASDNGAKIKAIVTTSAGTLTSADATLNVATFTSDFAVGVVKFEAYTGISGTAIDSLTSSDKYPASPDDTRLIAGIDSPNGYGDNYGARVSGFITPPETGSYRFFIRSDDASQLWLSTDDKEANAVMVAEETGCCNAFTEPDSPRTSEPISLTAGKKYAFYALVKEGGGGDYLQVAARKEGDTAAAGSLAPLSGAWVGANAKPSLGDPVITKQPSVSAQVVEGNSVNLSVEGHVEPAGYNFPMLVQWQKDGKDITGATKLTYLIPSAAAADGGTYRAVVSAPSGKTANSSDATFQVVPDTFAPKLANVGSLIKGTAVEIGVGFDEAVDSATAGVAANYSLSKGTITSVRYQPYAHPGEAGKFVLGTTGPFAGYAVVLATSGLAAGDSVTVTAKNVKDVKGNAMSATGESKATTVTKKMHWAAMGGTDYLEGATTNPDGIKAEAALWPDDAIGYSERDFDLVSGGTANWNNYDEATFVYEEVTGDFDKVVRLEYQDPTSQWARAGLCATPAADEGITRSQVEGGYQMAQRMLHRANPAVQWNGAAGNNANEFIYRDIAGGNYTGGGGGTPLYPNAWLRLQRKGQDFTGFYSSDGKTWTSDGTHTFAKSDTTETMPDKLLVGLYYSPELNNNGTGPGVGHSSVAKFRDYGDFGSSGGGGGGGGEPTLQWSITGKALTITYTGDLQSADKVSGPWNKEAGTSPKAVDTSSGTKYYRATQP